MQTTFFWHDYETFGANPWHDRPVQFAGQRTDAELTPIGEPVMYYARPPREMPPQPQACLITGITPQLAEHEGVIEAEFAARVHEQLARPGTCGVGYNSLRFDDEFTRQLLYRNFYDPYAREWEHGNARWDLIDLVRMCQALRPEGLVWPQRDDGAPSFKLEHLASANQLQQARAHDALSDVQALIELARLIRSRQPKLWDWYYALRHKQPVLRLLDLIAKPALLHISSRYPAQRHCLSAIVPLAEHPSRPNEIIVYDLAQTPDALLKLDPEAIAERLFTPRADLPDDVERIALRTVRVNHAPALAPFNALKGVDTKRLGLDWERCLQHRKQLLADTTLGAKVQQVFRAASAWPPAADPELAIYDGFLPAADRRLLAEVRATPARQLGQKLLPFRDPRYPELLFRYRARNWPDTLNPAEAERWRLFCQQRLKGSGPLGGLSLESYREEIAALRFDPKLRERQGLLDQLAAWGETLEILNQ